MRKEGDEMRWIYELEQQYRAYLQMKVTNTQTNVGVCAKEMGNYGEGQSKSGAVKAAD